jgi:excisionase family DNA binding protein
MSTLLTVSEAARELSKCTDTVREWARRGRLPVIRTEGGLRLFRREDVERIAQEMRVEVRDKTR